MSLIGELIETLSIVTLGLAKVQIIKSSCPGMYLPWDVLRYIMCILVPFSPSGDQIVWFMSSTRIGFACILEKKNTQMEKNTILCFLLMNIKACVDFYTLCTFFAHAQRIHEKF